MNANKKIILITGAQGSGKTKKALEIIGKQTFVYVDKTSSIDMVLTFRPEKKYILFDPCSSPEVVKAAVKEYNSFLMDVKPTLIICTQDVNAKIEGAEVIRIEKILS